MVHTISAMCAGGIKNASTNEREGSISGVYVSYVHQTLSVSLYRI